MAAGSPVAFISIRKRRFADSGFVTFVSCAAAHVAVVSLPSSLRKRKPSWSTDAADASRNAAETMIQSSLLLPDAPGLSADEPVSSSYDMPIRCVSDVFCTSV